MREHKHEDRYGCWAGNPKGYKADLSCCAASVHSNYVLYQCSRKCGHGPNGVYCKQHAKRYENKEAAK